MTITRAHARDVHIKLVCEQGLGSSIPFPRPCNPALSQQQCRSAAEKIRKYRPEFGNSCTPFFPLVASTSGRLHRELARLLFLQAHRKPNKDFEAQGLRLAQIGFVYYKRAAFYHSIKCRVGLVLAKDGAATQFSTTLVDPNPRRRLMRFGDAGTTYHAQQINIMIKGQRFGTSPCAVTANMVSNNLPSTNTTG